VLGVDRERHANTEVCRTISNKRTTADTLVSKHVCLPERLYCAPFGSLAA
jgi:hypothetical protein